MRDIMTRPKVPDERRRRTAQACYYCKHRKQKCNGLKPCATCAKRDLKCTYVAPTEPDYENGPSTKRRRLEAATLATSSKAAKDAGPHHSLVSPSSSNAPKGQQQPETPSRRAKGEQKRSRSQDGPSAIKGPGVPKVPADQTHHRRTVSDQELENLSRNSTISGADEEAPLYSTTRMLQDQTGRLLYLGDSATLSYLHLFRIIVESVSGYSQFTTDPRKEKIVENVVSLPPHIRPPCMLPDRATANVLVDSYFVNTNSLIEVFNRADFQRSLDACYASPLSMLPPFLCLLNLVFAIGLVLATPEPDSPEQLVIERLRSGSFDQAELFFRSAKCLGDPLTGFEDADFWSVQALVLMSVYMLAVSKRNAAYSYHGMAVRSAYALGLHREEVMTMFRDSGLALRCNLWRSIFILDRFLAASLGRPTAISEDDCSDAALELPLPFGAGFGGPGIAGLPHSGSLDAAVHSCRIIGDILKKIYAKRKVSIKTAQEIARQCAAWPQQLHPSLRWQQALSSSTPPGQGIAILHANLFYCHSVTLLTRPFFIHIVHADQSDAAAGRGPSRRRSSRMQELKQKFSEVCVTASYHTIAMIYTAHRAKYLPQRNPFVMYFLFTAALIILSNEFMAAYENPAYEACISQAIDIMQYFSTADPQGDRLLWILRAFKEEVTKQSAANPGPRVYRFPPPPPMIDGSVDPVLSFFSAAHPVAQHSSAGSHGPLAGSAPTLAPRTAPVRHNSLPSLASLPSSGAPRLRLADQPLILPAGPEGLSKAGGKKRAQIELSPVEGSPVLLYGMDSVAEDDDSRGAGGSCGPESIEHEAAGFDFDSLWDWPASGGLGGDHHHHGHTLHPHQAATTVVGGTPCVTASAGTGATVVVGPAPPPPPPGVVFPPYAVHLDDAGSSGAGASGGHIGPVGMSVPLFPASNYG